MRPVCNRISANLGYSTPTLFAGLLLLLLPACTQSPPDDTASKAAAPRNSPFKPVTYSLLRLEQDSLFVDSLRALPRADSAWIKLLTQSAWPAQRPSAFDSATAYYRYRTLSLPPYRGEVVVTISDYNTLSGSLRLLLFSASNHWVSTSLLAKHYDEAGAREDLLSVQRTPTAFWQQKLAGGVKEIPAKEADKPSRYVGHEDITTHYLLQFRAGKFTKTLLDSTYRLTKD